MGLDMYLEARVYTSKYFNGEGEGRVKALQAAEALGMPNVIDNIGSITISREMAYWRKANQIHAWFVKNVQDGKDECQNSYVDQEQLIELRDLCKSLLVNKGEEEAKEKLPSQSGFFFGGTEYDEWYWGELENTVEMLDRIISLPSFKDLEFQYHASW